MECLRVVRAKAISLEAHREREERFHAIGEYCGELKKEAAKLATYLQLAQRVIDAIANEDHRAAFELYYLNGWTWEDVAKRFRKTRQTIWRWSRAGEKEIQKNGQPYLDELRNRLKNT